MVGHITAHAAVGGITEVARGGKFGHGFLSAGITKGVFLNYNGYEPGSNTEDIFNRLALHAVVGGTSSNISGGKFANGAKTAAFQFLFNECSSGNCDEWFGTRTNTDGDLIICILPSGCNKSAHLPRASTLEIVEGVAGMAPGAGKGVQLITRMSKTKKSVDKFSRAPKSIQDQMTLRSAKEGNGNMIIDNLSDPKFKGMQKMELKVKSANGNDSVVHYVRDPKTGNLMDFKFKKHSTQGMKPWGNDPVVPPGGR